MVSCHAFRAYQCGRPPMAPMARSGGAAGARAASAKPWLLGSTRPQSSTCQAQLAGRLRGHQPQLPPPLALLPGSSRRRHAAAGTSRASAAKRTPVRCESLPRWAAEKAVEALKEQHGRPSDMEVAAAATAAMAATAASFKHSKSAVGYLAKEAPLRTWMPLLLCLAAAAAGRVTDRIQVVWAAMGGMATFVFTIWQVLAPLVRRFQELRRHLLDNDRAAKQRLDAAAEQLHKVLCERAEALQDAEQSRGELQAVRQQMEDAAWQGMAAAGLRAAPGAGPSEPEGGGGGAGAAENADVATESAEVAAQRAELEARLAEVQRELEARREQDKDLAGVLNNALNAAAVPTGPEGECPTCESAEMDTGDGYNERPVDRSNAMELAAALQSRVDVLRRQAQDVGGEHGERGEVYKLHAELREQRDTLAAMHAQLEMARADSRRLPQVQQYARDLEWQLLQAQQAQQAQSEAAGRQAGAAAADSVAPSDAAGEGEGDPHEADDSAEAGHDGERLHSGHSGEADGAANSAVPGPVRRGRGRPRGSTTKHRHLDSKGEDGWPLQQLRLAESKQRLAEQKLAAGARAAQSVAAELACLRQQVATAERHLEAYDDMVHDIEGKLGRIQGQATPDRHPS